MPTQNAVKTPSLPDRVALDEGLPYNQMILLDNLPITTGSADGMPAGDIVRLPREPGLSGGPSPYGRSIYVICV